MASDPSASPPSRPPRWRGAGKVQGPAARAAGRRQRIIAVVAVMLLLGGGALAWMLIPQPPHPPHLVTVLVTEYPADGPVPPNPLARQDSDVLLALFGDSVNGFDHQTGAKSRELLARLKDRGEKTPVVVYLTAHAVVRGGEVVLLPADATPDSGLRLADVLGYLKQCRAEHRLLILDVMKPAAADPRLGLLYDDVADRVADEVQANPDPGLLVLLACSPGQASLVSEELGQSVFGYYLAEGLRGKADGQGQPAERDGRVSVRELAEYVARRVDRWAWQNRAAHQVPKLLGDPGLDFVLSYEPKDGPEGEGQLGEYPPWLAAAWKQRDDLADDGSWRAAPAHFRQLEGLLLRAEQDWRAGEREDRVRQRLADVPARAADIRAAAGTMRVAGVSVAADRDGAEPTAALQAAREALRGLLEGVPEKLRGRTKEEKDAQAKAAQERQKAEGAWLKEHGAKLAPPELTWLLFDVAAEGRDLGMARYETLLELLDQARPPRTAEVIFLQRLRELLDKVWELGRKGWEGPVHYALQAARKAEMIAARDARALPWVQAALGAALDEQREGEKLLFEGFAQAYPDAEQKLRHADGELDKALKAMEAVGEAHRQRDRAFHELPAWVPYLLAGGAPDDRAVVAWGEAIDSAVSLHERLTKPSADAVGQVEILAGELRDRLDGLPGPSTRQRLDRLLQEAKEGTPRQYLAVQSALAVPSLRGGDRLALWKAGHEVAESLAQRTAALDAEEDGKAPGPAPEQIAPDVRARLRQASRRARLWVGLLRLGGFAGADALDQEREALAGRSDAAAWGRLAEALRRAWLDEAPRQLREEKDLAAADRLARVLGSAVPVPDEPASQLRRSDLQGFGQWQADRLDKVAKRLPAYEKFYTDAAARWRSLGR